MQDEYNKLLKTIELDFGIFKIYKDFSVGEWTDNHVSPEQVIILIDLFDSEFEGRPYGYVANRINPHSIDVTGVARIGGSESNLKRIAFVSYTTTGRSIAYLEKGYYKKHDVEVFASLEKAIEWMHAGMIVYR